RGFPPSLKLGRTAEALAEAGQSSDARKGTERRSMLGFAFSRHAWRSTMSSSITTIDQIAASFAGQLLQPTDPAYDDARRVHNGLVDKRPVLIARCRGVADIADAVKLAGAMNVDVAVRGGGHNVAGRATIDGGLMIDLSPVKGIHGDPRARAASLEYALHPVGPIITGGVVAHPVQHAVEVLRFFRDTCASLPEEVMFVAGLQTAPDGSGAKLVGIVGGHCGSLADGEAAIRPIKVFGSPIMDMMGPIPYSALNTILDPAFPKGALNYWKSQFLTDLSDEAIRTLLDCF